MRASTKLLATGVALLLGSLWFKPATAEELAHARVMIDPATFAGTVELIRQKYNRQTQMTTTDYRTNTLTRTTCP